MAGVTLERVSKVFDGGHAAVRDLDLDIRDGEFVVIVGPSGSGKTTVLRIIAGLESPTSGQIRIGQRDVTDVAPRDRDIAMVFQNYALYPHMTVRENLGFGLRMRRIPRAEVDRRIRAVAAKLGIELVLDRKPAVLSGGQRQRVALGRAIVREPRVFLFDEPLSNLDARLRVETRAELVRLHRQLRTTMIYVTHDQTEAMTMGERIAVMSDGVLQQLAAPLDLYNRPANRFVAGFIGSPPMNFFEGRIESVGGAARFRSGGLTLFPPASAPTGEQLVAGVRPEHLDVLPADAADRDIAVRVQVIEPLGAETLLYCTTELEGTITVRLPGDPGIQIDEEVGLRVDRDALHWFDATTGVAFGKN